jgi:hypothetical protein
MTELKDALSIEQQRQTRAETVLQAATIRHENAIQSVTEQAAAGDEGADPAIVCRQHQAAISSLRQRTVALEQLLDQLADRDEHLGLEVASQRVRGHDVQKRLEVAQQRLVDLEQQRATDVQSLQKKKGAAWKLRCIIDGHIEDMRRSHQLLRQRLQEEQISFLGSLQGWEQQCQMAFSVEKARQQSANHSALLDAAAVSARAGEALASRLGELRGAAGGLRARVSHVVRAVASRAQAVEALRPEVVTTTEKVEHLLMCISAALPRGLSNEARKRLQEEGADIGTDPSNGAGARCGTISAEAADVLRAEVNECLDTARTDVTTSERQRLAAQCTQRLAENEARAEEWAAQARHECDNVQRTISELDATLRGLWKANADASNSTAVRELELRIAALTERLESMEKNASGAERQSQEMRETLDEEASAMTVAVEDARRETREPLQRELSEASNCLDGLRRKFDEEMQRREAEWDALNLYADRENEEKRKGVDAVLGDDIGRLQQELDRVRTTEGDSLDTQQATMETFRDNLSVVARSTEEAYEKRRVLEGRKEGCVKLVNRHQDAVKQIEIQITNVITARQRDILEAKEDEHERARRHAEAMAWHHRQREETVAHLERSLGTLSADLSSGSQAALQAHSELQTSAELLAHRARAQLTVKMQRPQPRAGSA